MRPFEPMSEEEIRGWIGANGNSLTRLAKTALHHLARVAALEVDLADAHGRSEWAMDRIKALEELTTARRERDDAQARVRELEATTTAATIRDVHKALGATVGQSVVTRAEEVMEELRATREDDAARRATGKWLAAPPQQTVFRIIPRITVDRGAVRFDVVTTDPGILALTAVQLSQLGLVVCDG